MSALILPKRYHPDFRVPNRKPVGGVEVDDNSPLSRGLLHAYLLDGVRVVGGNPGIYSGPIYRDLVNQKSNLIVNNYKSSGDRIIESASTANYGVVSAANFEHPDKELMVYVVAKTYSTTGNSGKFPFAATMEVGTPYSGFLCGLKDAGLPYFHIGGVFAGNELVGTGDYRDDDWHSYLYHYDGYTMSIWIDGTLNASKSRTNDVGVNNEFRLGHVQSYGTYHDTEYKSCLIWGKSCPARVVIDAPYSALKPSNPITYFIPSAGGGAVAQQIDLQWGVRQLINQSANLHWGVLNTVSQSSSLQWALLNTVSNNTDLRWGLLSLVNQTSDLRWDILAALGLVGQSVDLQWDMLQKAAQSTDLRWRILSLVFKDTDLRWGLINNVSQQADLRYALLANAAQTIDLQWDTLSSLASVGNSVDLRWDILAYVSQSLDAQWSTLELVSTETDLQWQIAVLVSKDADLQWALKQSAGQAVDIRWDVIAKTSQSIDLRWSIISDNQFTDITGVITLRSNTPIITLH